VAKNHAIAKVLFGHVFFCRQKAKTYPWQQ